MAIFKQESLELLRQRIDLVEVIDPYVELKKMGATYKGLCPFHDEKSPSFIVDKSDHHYHCYGCGAHGDAIRFLMEYSKMAFSDAVEALAQRFGVHLEREDGIVPKGPPKAKMKELLSFAGHFYHFLLLHTPEGHQALEYLYDRGLDLSFIRRFEIGLAPRDGEMLFKVCQEKKWGFDLMETVGLAAMRGGRRRPFFEERITFPIRDPMGSIIGFSARKFKEETFGGKYVNTPETPLFKKSRVLFGLNDSRRRIAKEHQVIIVEGQVDALRLIEEGFNFTVAGQGTAFGEGHAKELINMGVQKAYLAMDADEAGKEAAAKIGNLFQREGVEVRVVEMDLGSDPDTLLREEGPDAFQKLLESSVDYITFLVNHQARYVDMNTPAGKNQLITTLSKQIRGWDQEVMVHESLRKLAHIARVPEGVVGVGQQHVENIHIQRSGSARALGGLSVDPDRILELDLIRWVTLLVKERPDLVALIRENIAPEDLHNGLCRESYQLLLARIDEQQTIDPLALASCSENMQQLLQDLMERRVNAEKAEELIEATIQKILDRNWMKEREEVRMKIQAGEGSSEEVMALLKTFSDLGNKPPKMRTLGAPTELSEQLKITYPPSVE